MARNLFGRRAKSPLPSIETKDFSAADGVLPGPVAPAASAAQFIRSPRRPSTTVPSLTQRPCNSPIPGQQPGSRRMSKAHTLEPPGLGWASASGGRRSPSPCGSASPASGRSPVDRRTSMLRPMPEVPASPSTASSFSGRAAAAAAATASAAAAALLPESKRPEPPSRKGSKTATATAAVVLQQRRPASRSGEAEEGDSAAEKLTKGHDSLMREINAEMEQHMKKVLRRRSTLICKEDVDDMFSSMFSRKSWQDQAAVLQLEPEEWQEKAEERKVELREKKTWVDMVMNGQTEALQRQEDDDDEAPESLWSPATGSTAVGSSSSDADFVSSTVSGDSVAKAAAGSDKLASTMNRVRAKMNAVKSVNLWTGDLKHDQEMRQQELMREAAGQLRGMA